MTKWGTELAFPARRGGVRAKLAAVAVALLCLSGCPAGQPRAGGQPRAAGSPPRASSNLVVLDAAGRLTAYDIRDLSVRWSTTLPASFGEFPRHAVAAGTDGLVYAVAAAEDSHPALFAVDARTGRIRFTLPLPAGVEARVPVPDPARGRLYLLATRPSGTAGGRQAVVVVVDPIGRRVMNTVPASPADRRDWIPYAGALIAGSDRLAISYHGETTTGMAIVDAGTLRPVPCPAPCRQVHGRILSYLGGLAAATGGEELLLLTMDGEVTRRLDSQLAGNHLMEFDVDDARQTIYAIGPCGYTGGLAAIAGTTRLIRPPGTTVTDRVCGDRISVVDHGAAVAVTGGNGIRIVDVRSGKTVHAASVDRAPIDAVYLADGG